MERQDNKAGRKIEGLMTQGSKIRGTEESVLLPNKLLKLPVFNIWKVDADQAMVGASSVGPGLVLELGYLLQQPPQGGYTGGKK